MAFQGCIVEANWKMPLHNWCQTIKLGNEGKSSEKFENWYKVILSYSPTQSSLWVSALLPLSSPLFLFLHQSSFCCCHLWAMWPLYHHYTTCTQCTKNKKDWLFYNIPKHSISFRDFISFPNFGFLHYVSNFAQCEIVSGNDRLIVCQCGWTKLLLSILLFLPPR